jgi:hypothetical protein
MPFGPKKSKCHIKNWSIGNFLCTGGIYYALFISLLISKLLWTNGCLGRGITLPSASLSHRDEVNSLCPGGGGVKVNSFRPGERGRRRVG